MLKFSSVLVMALILGMGSAGCDKAEEAMQKTDLGPTAEASQLVGSATKALAGITDIESAKAALPALKDIDIDLGKLMAKVKDMSPEQKSKLTGAVAKVMPQLESVMAKVTSMDGVGEIVGPTLESLMGKFKGMM